MNDDEHKANAVMQLLIDETVKYRDRVKEETGETVTVEDTRIALAAVDDHLAGRKTATAMTERQAELAKILIDTVIKYQWKG